VGFEMFAELWYDLRSLQQNTLLILGGISVFLIQFLYTSTVVLRIPDVSPFLSMAGWPPGK
jgi:hypothetical protein